MRAVASTQVCGPVTWWTVRCPRSRRCRVAIRAPSSWSMVTVGAPMEGSLPTTTSGMLAVELGDRLNHPAHGGDDDDALNVGGPQPMQCGGHVVAAPAERHEAQRMPRLARRRLNAVQHVRWAELVGLDRHDAQCPRATPGEDPCRGVRLVAQRRHRLFDSYPGLVGDAGEPVQHPGDRHHRDAGLCGHVSHDGAAGGGVGRHASS